MLEQLNTDHAIDGHLHFEAGQGGLIKAVIANQYADAEIYLHGAHITHFQPQKQEPILWMSSQAQYQADGALRGGIPVIWPWFGAHPTDSNKPSHGFVRVMDWSVIKTSTTESGETIITLGLTDSETTRSLWDHPFALTLTATVGTTMQVDLTATNAGSQPFEAGAALHTYFNIGHIEQIHIAGLDGRDYLDKVTGFDRKHQDGPIHIASEVDRVYLDTDDEVVIHDKVLKRKIRVGNAGSRSTVVWNPWRERSAQIGDFPNDGYETMVCVETANAATDVRTIAPGASHTLTQIISAG